MMSVAISPQHKASHAFYEMMHEREITVTHVMSMGASSHQVAVHVDRGPDHHTFTRLSLLKGEDCFGKAKYVIWYFKSNDSNRAGVGVMEYKKPDEIWDPALVRTRF
jgi:hypothetical protein